MYRTAGNVDPRAYSDLYAPVIPSYRVVLYGEIIAKVGKMDAVASAALYYVIVYGAIL